MSVVEEIKEILKRYFEEARKRSKYILPFLGFKVFRTVATPFKRFKLTNLEKFKYEEI